MDRGYTLVEVIVALFTVLAIALSTYITFKIIFLVIAALEKFVNS